ncbi:sensor histidine kinase [Pedobacter sp. 22163]|uniref:sensor histidine kinase n=1 Tax=Pedobacter sp. 22163 TaxID=3453883 RepID=UPI003F830D4B
MENDYLNPAISINSNIRYGNLPLAMNRTTAKWQGQNQIHPIGYNDHLNRAGVGFWRFHCSGSQLELCAISARMLQLKTLQGLCALSRRIHPLSRKGFLMNISELADTGNGFEEDLHIVLKGGESRWFKVCGILEQQEDGPRMVSGTILDITAFKLEEVRRMDMMAFMSHELKTPLTTLRLYLQAASKFRDLRNEDFFDHQLGKADLQISAMNNLINSYLNSSIEENSATILHKVKFDFSQLLYDTVSHYAEINPDHVFKVELTESLFIDGDINKLTQVINNFITNAVKFSSINCFIKINCERVAQGIRFLVMDHGMGIARADQEKLFKKHFRASNARTGNVSGHGLGLYLSKQIIELHKGSVFFESELGVGSIFGFIIPSTIGD